MRALYEHYLRQFGEIHIGYNPYIPHRCLALTRPVIEIPAVWNDIPSIGPIEEGLYFDGTFKAIAMDREGQLYIVAFGFHGRDYFKNWKVLERDLKGKEMLNHPFLDGVGNLAISSHLAF